MSLHFVTPPYLSQRFLRVRRPFVLKACNASVLPVVVIEGVGFFAMNGVVANCGPLVRHAKGHTADVFNEQHDKGRPDNVPADDEESADDLYTNLSAIACDSAAGNSETEGSAAFLCRPQT